jgi:hypothetical protein
MNNKALIIPIILFFIGVATYTEILYLPFAVALIMLIFIYLLAYLNHNSDPDFPTTRKKN